MEIFVQRFYGTIGLNQDYCAIIVDFNSVWISMITVKDYQAEQWVVCLTLLFTIGKHYITSSYQPYQQ